MRLQNFRTKCTVRVQQSKHHRNDYYLFIEAYPIFENDNAKPKRKYTALNRKINTIIWDINKKTRDNNFFPRRNSEGVIMCKSEIDNEACLFAHKVCRQLQNKYDEKALYPELYHEKQKVQQRSEISIINYIEAEIQRRALSSSANRLTYHKTVLAKIKKYIGNKDLKFSEIDETFFTGFYDFIMSEPTAKNTKVTYIESFKTIIKQAQKDNLTSYNPKEVIPKIKRQQSQKHYLTLSELQTIAAAPCGNHDTKQASLFSALTGLRYSDIAALTWEQITDGDNPRIEFQQQKTKGIVYLPISVEALQLCGERKNPEDLIFPNITSGKHISKTVKKWAQRAGITKHITFHCFRHTFATLQLSQGTDIYTVSKMLGHTDLKTTQIYAQIIDEKKQAAANAIKINV